jgi:hypothetical protein
MSKIKSFSALPKDYQEAFSVDLLKDKKMLLMINLLSLLMLLPVALVYYLIIKYTDKVLIIEGTITELWKYIVFIISMVLYIIIHELIHAVFFKLATKEKVKFRFHGIMASASVPGIYFYKKPYLIVGLAPAVIMSIVLIIPGFFLDGIDLLLLTMIFAVHFSGCVGDFYISLKLLKYPRETLIEDTGTGMKFYIIK